MTDRYPPVADKCPHFLHGGDYNPDQWPRATWAEDMRLMKLARCNAMSVGIFSWAQIEVAEGRFDFGWLDEVMDLLAGNGAFALLATPSAAQPAWMSAKYPEILRVDPDGRRRPHRKRVNYCLTSPLYREKCAAIAAKLAERYRDHPALLMWHVSNEYGGACYCDLCRQAFRDWLRAKYGSIEQLNQRWWTAFWGHTFRDFAEIDALDPSIHAMGLDWMRFVTDQTISFFLNEAAPLRRITPDVPVTTNMMGTYPGLNYWRFAPHVDRVSWDSYPQFHDRDDDWLKAAGVSFTHDIYRCLKGGRPFLLMESTPSSTNWFPVAKLKRPGLHRLMSLQAVAHGSDSVQYFQWRKGRGGSEKFHGAVVDHCGHENTRVFRDVADVGSILARLDDVLGTTIRAEAAVIYDWENRWAIDAAAGPRRDAKDYEPTCVNHYRPLWARGVAVDVIDMDQPLDAYRLLVAPMLYMLRPGTAERIARFVREGGTFVTTYLSGIADENDLTFTGGFPGPLREVLGIWAEEIDALHDDETNGVVFRDGNELEMHGEYAARTFCDLIHAETADVLAAYTKDFYAGRPALTVNHYGAGRAFYIASRNEPDFLDAFYGRLVADLGLPRALPSRLPEGVTVQRRTDGEREFLFVMNFKRHGQFVQLGEETFLDLLNGEEVRGERKIDGYGVLVLERPCRDAADALTGAGG